MQQLEILSQKMKQFIISFGFCLLGISLINGQSLADGQYSSLTNDIIYNGRLKPDMSAPRWNSSFIELSKSRIEINADGLSIKSSDGANVIYTLSGSDFNPGNQKFALEFVASVDDSGALGIDVRSDNGQRAYVNIFEDHINSQKTIDSVIKDNMDNSTKARYRIAVGNEYADIYKNAEWIGSVDLEREDVIEDNGFENSTNETLQSYWEKDGYTIFDVITGSAGNQVHSGTKALEWDNNWNGRFMSRIPVQPNSTYRLSYWAKLTTVSAWGQTTMNGGVWVDGAQVGYLNVSGGWKQYTCEFTTGENTTYADIYYHNGWTGDGRFKITFDDMELTQLSGKNYLRFGKINTSGNSEILISSIAYKPGDAYRPIGKTQLLELYNKAETAYNTAENGTSNGEYPSYAYDKLNADLVSAQSLINNQNITIDEIDSLYLILEKSYSIFLASKIDSDLPDLTSIGLAFDKNPIKAMESTRLSVTGKMSDNSDADLTKALITYTSSDENIAAIDDNGNIQTLQDGVVQIMVKVNLRNVELTKTQSLTVEAYSLVSVDLTAYQTTLRAGEASGTKVLALMSDGTEPDLAFLTKEFVVSDESILEINPYGSIIAKKAGNAIVKVKCTYMERDVKEDEIEITVVDLDEIVLQFSSDEYDENSKGSFSVEALMTDGSRYELDKNQLVFYSSDRNVLRMNTKGECFAYQAGVSSVLCAIVANGEVKSTELSITVKPTSSGKEEFSVTENFILYPNPVKEMLFVQNSESIPMKICVYDFMGKQIMKSSIVNSLNVSELPKGYYVLELEGKGNWKFIKD